MIFAPILFVTILARPAVQELSASSRANNFEAFFCMRRNLRHREQLILSLPRIYDLSFSHSEITQVTRGRQTNSITR